MDTEDAFTLSIVYGRNSTVVSCASEARCLIRIAQLSLGTTTRGNCEFSIVTPENIKKAKGCLDKVELNSLPRRCLTLYYIIESDLFRNMSNITMATESAEKALYCYGIELHSAESRLQALTL